MYIVLKVKRVKKKKKRKTTFKLLDAIEKEEEKNESQPFSNRYIIPIPIVILFFNRKTSDSKIIRDIPNHKRDKTPISN